MSASHGGARTGAGRKPKPQIEQRASKGIASEVLAMDGPPDHVRRCKCRICEKHPKNCTCREQCGDCGKLKENCQCEKYRAIKIECRACSTVADHKICHCEHCRWWRHRLSRDARVSYDADVYLTNRRDGKPAQGVFVGDTRENAPELDFGDLLMPSNAETQSGKAGKPN
jgi:hypothetical protein